MTDIFTNGFFIGNRKALRQTTDSNLIVLSANGLLQRSGDTTFPFRQDSNFWYLTGIEEPDFILVMAENEDFLIMPKRGEHRDLWDGIVNKKTIRQCSGIDTILEFHEGWLKLDKLLKKYNKVHTLAPADVYMEHFGFYANPARGVLLAALQKHRKLEIVDARKDIARQRQIKQSPEITVLQRAIDITTETLKDVRNNLTNYKTEYEVGADIAAGFLRRGASGHGYQPIIACGKHATTIHYTQNRAVLDEQLLLLDVGAEVANYSADITRTYAIKKPTPRQRHVHDSVIAVQQKAFDMLKPGIDMKEFEQAVDLEMARELRKLKVLGNINDKKKLKKYYPHLTSHFLGLDTHDAADYTRPLKPGMVLTVEPGIYLPDEEIGIRIEDDVLITETGIKVLSANLPTDLG
ncbi:aminopeptidase P family protein [Candidatus Saccharibacteria bacterium]|nr:aminopeptidase P family protein [Candidatus Saccharibacteria bacterium]